MKAVPAILAASLLAAATAGAAQPKLEVASPVFEFGTIAQGQEVRHTFELKNAGDAPLELRLAFAAQGATLVAPLAPIAPGQVAKLETVFDGAQPAGKASAEIVLRTNDPDTPTLRLFYQGEIEQLVRAKPGYARWNTVQGEPEATIGQTIWSADGKPFKVTEVESPHPYMRTTVRPAKPEERSPQGTGEQWRVELTLDSWPPVGAITGRAIVRTDHPQQKVVFVPLSGFVRPLVHVEPSTADVGTLAVSGTARSKHRVRFFGTTPSRVTRAETTVPGTSVTVEQIHEGRLYEVVIAFTPETPAGAFTGKLLIHTDNGKLPVYEVPIAGTVTNAASAAPAQGTAAPATQPAT